LFAVPPVSSFQLAQTLPQVGEQFCLLIEGGVHLFVSHILLSRPSRAGLPERGVPIEACGLRVEAGIHLFETLINARKSLRDQLG
jgi:hypothetical protein